jgi:hypothetical protein
MPYAISTDPSVLQLSTIMYVLPVFTALGRQNTLNTLYEVSGSAINRSYYAH